LQLRKSADKTVNPSTTQFILSWEKYRGRRDGNTGRDIVITLQSGPAAEGEGEVACWTCEQSAGQEAEIFAAMVKSGKYATQKEIAENWPGGNMTAVDLSRRVKPEALRLGLIDDKAVKGFLGGATKRKSKARAASTMPEDF
jgi:hypothetical protein